MNEDSILPLSPDVAEELPDDLHEEIEGLAEEGNELLDAGDARGALRIWREAFGRLPEPRNRWDAAMWLHASMAEAHYGLGDFGAARDAMQDALAIPESGGNPWLHYMLGKSLLRLGDARAVEALLRAYMLEGEDIFDEDGEDGAAALAVLREHGLLDD
ncbi:MAG: tetratricopeptide repeat protein [Luteimonas sp.]